MEKFIPRLTEPSYDDKNWILTANGGYNKCFKITNNSAIPNCVGYCWGRWLELLKVTTHKLSRQTAEKWFLNGDGYDRGNTPKLGAVICFKTGSATNPNDGRGHVAIVEKINADGSILVSSSDYAGRRFYTMTYKYPYSHNGLDFQGFIYPPVDFVEETQPKKTIDELAQEVIEGKWGNNPERKEALIAAGYDYEAVQKRVNEILNAQEDEELLELVRRTIRGDFGNGQERKNALGSKYEEVQKQVNLNLNNGNTSWNSIKLY